jgi:hypothetical protein
MTHLDDTALSLTALGEAPDPADAAHLDTCATCRAELARLQRTVTTARTIDPADLDLPAPPAHVWDAIAAEVGTTAVDEPRVVRDDATGDHDDPHPGGVVDLASRRPPPLRPPRWLSVAAAVLVLVVAAGAVIAAVRSSDSKSGQQEVALAAIGDSSASGRATVVAHDGGKALKVDTSGLAPLQGSDYELWLMNPDTNSFVSLGSVQPGVRSVHPIPAGVTVKTDPYVDISVEPRDGNPAHSTVSVLRGHF